MAAASAKGAGSWLRPALASAGGGTVAAAICAPLLQPGAGLIFWREKTVLLLAGNLVVGAAAGLLVHLLARAARRPLPAASQLLLGLGLGLGPWLGARAAFPFSGLVLAAAAGLAGLLVGSRLRLPRKAGPAAAGLGLLALVALTLWCRVAPYGSQPSPALAPPPAAAGSGPDVLLISVDTLRADALTAEGVDTPHLDALRARALHSDFALAPAGFTRPSHATMLSGAPIHRHGVWNNLQTVAEEQTMLAERFRDAGWRTVGVVSNGMLRKVSGFAQGFDTYDDAQVRYSGVITDLRRKAATMTWTGKALPGPLLDRLLTSFLLGLQMGEAGLSVPGRRTARAALGYLDGLLGDPAPWFLFLHFMDPHKPYWADPSVRERLARWRDLPARYRGRDPWKVKFDRLQRDAWEESGHEGLQEAAVILHRLYLEELLFVDRAVGEVLAKVEAGGRPTVVLFTSDHGEAFAEHALFLHGNSMYGELLEVPFLLAAPGGAPGPLPVRPMLQDVAPTLLAAAGLPHGDLPGRDLLAAAPDPDPPLLAGRSLHLRQGEPPGWREGGWQVALIEGDWKLVAHANAIGVDTLEVVPRELYRRSTDPGEHTSLLDQEPDRAAAMAAVLQRELSDGNPGSLEEMDTGTRAMMAEMGYAMGAETQEEEDQDKTRPAGR